MKIHQRIPLLLTVMLFVALPCLPARDLAPEYWFENLPAADGSVQQSLVFRTVAGVGCRVESSEDLISWDVD